jgi:dienelactone hydrolase
MKHLVVLLPLLLTGALTSQSGGPPAGSPADQWLTKPVDDRTFKTYLDFFTYDHQLPFDVRVAKVDEEQGLRRERLSLQSTPGQRVTAVFSRASAAASAKPPGLILLHGGGTLGKDAPFMLRLAELLSRAGWSVLSIDLQFFGERNTQLLTSFSEQEKHDKLYNQSSTYLAWVTQTVKDVSRGIDFMVEQRGVDARRTGLVGFSRGAILGAIAAGVDRRISPTVFLFGGHFDALETGHLPAACPANYIGRIAPRPLLIVNGTQDSDMIKDRAVDPLFALARVPKQAIWTDGGHGFMTEEHRAAVVQWLQAQSK